MASSGPALICMPCCMSAYAMPCCGAPLHWMCGWAHERDAVATQWRGCMWMETGSENESFSMTKSLHVRVASVHGWCYPNPALTALCASHVRMPLDMG